MPGANTPTGTTETAGNPATKITITSDLPRWDCVNVGPDGMAKDMAYMQQMLTLTSAANQLVSCMGIAQ